MNKKHEHLFICTSLYFTTVRNSSNSAKLAVLVYTYHLVNTAKVNLIHIVDQLSDHIYLTISELFTIIITFQSMQTLC